MSGVPDLGWRFNPLRALGSGGMSEVWLVEDAELGRTVVAKILPEDATSDQVVLMRHELEHARRLAHPGIVRVFDIHSSGARTFLTMEFVDGREVTSLCGRPPVELLPVVLQIADALEHAHSQGLVHRDLKASNVLIDESGAPNLLDFGIAAARGDRSLAGGGSLVSISPQQLAGEPPDPRDDVYGLGMLLYELVSGQPPFWPEITHDAIRSSAPPPVTSAWPVSTSLQRLVASMLAKRPEERPQDMTEVINQLRRIAQELGAGGPTAGRRPAKAEVPMTPPPRVKPVVPRSVAVSQPGQGGGDRGPALRLATAIVTVVLLGVAVGVFVFLPRWVDGRHARPKASDSSGSAAFTPAGPVVEAEALPDHADSGAVDRELVDQALGEVMRWQEELQTMDVDRWGGEAYAEATELVGAGDRRLTADDHAGAVEIYTEAAQRLQAIAARSSEVVGDALEVGRRALDAGDAASAAAAFELAASVEPDSQEARVGLQRARVHDEVRALLASAAEREREGELDQAEQRYRRAAALDPSAAAARSGVARVQQLRVTAAFATAMAEGLDALDREAYAEAREAFKKAGRVRPDDAAVADGIARAEQGIRSAVIRGHLEQAAVFDAAERWQDAADEFDSVLGIDPTIAAAQLGRDRALLRARLVERIAFHLDNPQRLATDEVLEAAVEVLDEAGAVESPGPALQDLVRRLERLLEVAQQPIEVVLQSDSATEVVVYRVGRLGTFASRIIELRPGTYTVVGSRKGYRDVRLELVVTPGGVAEPLVVRCTEAL